MSPIGKQTPFREDVLAGKRILITGGGTGLGKELARAFVSQGATVYICGRRQAVLDAAVAELMQSAAHGGRVESAICDVRDADQIEAMVERFWQDGPLTGLVNNAAANFISPSVDISPRGFAAVRSTVMDGALFATLACGRRWIAQGLPGSVVSMLVTWVWTGSAYVLPSTMAKTAVHAMTMSLAVEWGRHNIRVNAVAPGPFPTESAWEKLAPIPKANVGAASAEQVPLGRYGRMPELCNLLTFLQSDACDYITGANIAIDGGHHLAAPSTFAELGKLTPEDWAEAKTLVRGKAEQEKAQRSAG
ncbi:SDR family oxidoreductase [Hydrogenophaga sp.]|uniref:SDR family oxidoreductase n=1 Tax=Hydrogenophaga sp. TaxID=1904254 RepID=UPI002604510B|nr:SDR family oxidoreductase [Hydrogenophaga sp.]MCW5652140.1 SDR family oxidoreductase [Hydrogenophaga sp.]